MSGNNVGADHLSICAYAPEGGFSFCFGFCGVLLGLSARLLSGHRNEFTCDFSAFAIVCQNFCKWGRPSREEIKPFLYELLSVCHPPETCVYFLFFFF